MGQEGGEGSQLEVETQLLSYPGDKSLLKELTQETN